MNNLVVTKDHTEHKITGDVKVLIIPDIHLRASNFENRNYVTEVFGYLNKIVTIVKSQDINMVIFLGDIFDNAFNEKGSAQLLLRFEHIISEIKKTALVYSLMGNHELHNAHKGSPFFSITHICSDRVKKDLEYIKYKPLEAAEVLDVVDTIIINDLVQIDMFHFSDINKEYVGEKKTKYKIALFHDALVSSHMRSYIKEIVGEDILTYMKATDLDSSPILNNVDYAVIGDIHMRLGEFKVGSCLCDLSGTLGRTQYTKSQMHTLVDLPVFTITDRIIKSHIPFNLLPLEESFQIDILEQSKLKRVNTTKFKEALSTFYVTRDPYIDILNSDIKPQTKAICINALKDKNKNYASLVKAKEIINRCKCN